MEYKVHIRYSFDKKLDDGRVALRYADIVVKLDYDKEQPYRKVTDDSIVELKRILRETYKRTPIDITIIDINDKQHIK